MNDDITIYRSRAENACINSIAVDEKIRSATSCVSDKKINQKNPENPVLDTADFRTLYEILVATRHNCHIATEQAIRQPIFLAIRESLCEV